MFCSSVPVIHDSVTVFSLHLFVLTDHVKSCVSHLSHVPPVCVSACFLLHR